MPEVRDRPANQSLTEQVSETLYPYLRAWTDGADIGDPAFDECATVKELSLFLAAKLTRHRALVP